MLFDQTLASAGLVHGFAAEDWVACWNMHLRGTLTSFDFGNEIEFTRSGIRDTKIEDLRLGKFTDVFMAPRMTCLWQAAIIRSGGWIGQGAPPAETRKASPEECERVVRQADRELQMESLRRILAPEAPSRIGCLYLAEDTPAGRNMVSGLKGHDAFLMSVEIVASSRFIRVDSRWLEGDPLDHEQIVGYWSGEPRFAVPVWEYLLDGAISCTDEEQLARLKEWAVEAARRANGTQGPIGSPQTPSRAVPFPSAD